MHAPSARLVVLVVADGAGAADSLRLALAPERYEVVWASGVDAALDALDERPVSLVLLEAALPGIAGVDSVWIVRRKHGKVPIVVVGGALVAETAARCMRLGASDVLSRSWTDVVLAERVRELAQASAPQSSTTRFRLDPAEVAGRADRAARRVAELWGLTPAETRVMRSLVTVSADNSNRAIAARIGCSVPTVEAHMTSILRKSGLDSRTALVSELMGFIT
jgi:DNA-binding NarL/FixJ family response regulator